MIHVPQQLNFSQSAFRIDLIVERVADLLDGNLLASLRIDSSTDDAAGAAADGADGRDVLGGDLEEVAVDVVLHVAAAVRVRALDLRLPAVAEPQAPPDAGAASASSPLHAHRTTTITTSDPTRAAVRDQQ